MLCSKFITSNTVQIIVDGWKEATNKANRIKQALPIHCLCENLELDEEVKLDVLRTIVEIYPQSLQVRDNEHHLPIHIAAKYQGASFCKVLIDRYPESLRLGC